MIGNEPAAEALRRLWGELPGQAGMVLGTEVAFEDPVLEEHWRAPREAYVARLESQDGAHRGWVVFDMPAAIAAAGLLVMRQETTIRERIKKGTFEGDDFDALGEFVNQIMPAINDALKSIPGEVPHFIFKEGTTDAAALPPAQGVVVVHGPVEVGGLAKGHVFLLFLPLALGIEPPEEDASGGVELTAEELAAIREATRESNGTRTLLVVPLERERARWTELLDGVGLEYDFVLDVAGLRRQLAKGEVGVVIIDADACPAGGLPILAALRTGRGPRIPAVVVASAPTRSHLLSCVAAGAHSYLTKPFEPQALLEAVESTSLD